MWPTIGEGSGLEFEDMDKLDGETSKAVRELVEFLKLSGKSDIARQDLEIAASVLFADPAAFLSLYDLTSQMRVAPSPRLRCDFADVRTMASRLIGNDDMVGLAKMTGGTIPEDCESRLDAAMRNPSLRTYYLASAADRFAHHVMDALRILAGQEGAAVVLDLPRDLDVDSLADIPYLSMLRYDGDARAR